MTDKHKPRPARRPGSDDPAHVPERRVDQPNPGDPGPPVLEPRKHLDPLQAPRIPVDAPKERGI